MSWIALWLTFESHFLWRLDVAQSATYLYLVKFLLRELFWTLRSVLFVRLLVVADWGEASNSEAHIFKISKTSKLSFSTKQSFSFSLMSYKLHSSRVSFRSINFQVIPTTLRLHLLDVRGLGVRPRTKPTTEPTTQSSSEPFHYSSRFRLTQWNMATPQPIKTPNDPKSTATTHGTPKPPPQSPQQQQQQQTAQLQPQIEQLFPHQGLNGGWQSDRDVQERRKMIAKM